MNGWELHFPTCPAAAVTNRAFPFLPDTHKATRQARLSRQAPPAGENYSSRHAPLSALRRWLGIPPVAEIPPRWQRRAPEQQPERAGERAGGGRDGSGGLGPGSPHGPALPWGCAVRPGVAMATLAGQGAQGGPREPKRTDALADDWCDSGLGSLSEGQLGQLQGDAGLGLAAHTDAEMEPQGPAATPEAGPLGPGEPPGAPLDEEGSERLDSAIGDSLRGDEDVGGLVEGVGAVRIDGEVAAAVAPEAWLHHVLGFVTEDGDTALHLAVIHEHEAFLDSILQYTERTDYLDIQNDLGQTALHIAVILDASHFVGKLVSAGAGLCVQEKGGNTALHLACREGRQGCAQRLLTPPVSQRLCHGNSFRAQLDCTNYDGYTPLHVAVLRKDLEMVRLLIAGGADLNKPELSCGRSPLHLAVESQNPEVVECLLRAGANPESRMYVGYTPMYSAIHRPDQKIPRLLQEFGSEEPDWESEESLDSNSEEEYDDIVINSGR